MPAPRIVVVMGVAGSGKTTVGRALADALGWDFFDSDEHHSGENVDRMRRGQPLTDEHREPWLAALRDLIGGVLARGGTGVLACSALRQSYRDTLAPSASMDGEIAFVYLRVSGAVLESRLRTREEHFAGVELLESQLRTLEEPEAAIWVDGSADPDEIVLRIRETLGV